MLKEGSIGKRFVNVEQVHQFDLTAVVGVQNLEDGLVAQLLVFVLKCEEGCDLPEGGRAARSGRNS